ncbi:ABC transporter ATP-binding protein [Kutzneria sp. NPDC052558]|uniref:ABC transporter ATP-binding protein n=1 Tax=Kutzneria sp. NPDC052558 TaxID=3364121 RepID=UPI0037CA75DE
MVTPSLRVRGLSVRFGPVAAASDVSFDLKPGEVLVLVGESGCGKSVVASGLLGLLPANASVTGQAMLGPTDLLALGERRLAAQVRGRQIGLVPQSAATHLHPVRTVRAQLAETLRELGVATTVEQAAERARLPADHLDRYPHQLSGGLAQRAAIALALAGSPGLILADEPTTGLDRALVHEITAEFRRIADAGHAVLMVTHDLAAAERIADRVAVMYAGRIVENAPAEAFFARPRHPYARGLLNALPEREFVPIAGNPPQLSQLPAGCAFRPRCPLGDSACARLPASEGEEHVVACHHA